MTRLVQLTKLTSACAALTTLRRAKHGSTFYHATSEYNDSNRPIRDVAARLQPAPGEDWQPAVRVAWVPESASPFAVVNPNVWVEGTDASSALVIRSQHTCALRFDLTPSDKPEARTAVRFTDDAGLYWQIDHNLHLQKLEQRDW